MTQTPPSERETRAQRFQDIKNAGINPYPARFHRTHTLAEIPALSATTYITIAGRLMRRRNMGKIIFCHIQDWSGTVQIVFKKEEVGDEQFDFFVDTFDVGDFIGVEGEVFTTQKGEISVLVKKYQVLGKALLPLPEKWHGVKDTETIYRQRYLDLIMNQDSKKRFAFRSQLIQSLRQYYWQEKFIEVETPTFLHQATGATATPYKTHHNALDMDMYLRISHELPLKELVVGGMEKVFELGKAYRNEGIDPSHLPEHTHLEHYGAYWDFEDNITFVEHMFEHLFTTLGISKQMDIEDRDGTVESVDWSTPWPRVNFVELIKKDTDLDVLEYTDAKTLLKDIKKAKIEFEDMDNMSLAGLVDNLYKKVSRPRIVNPTILTHYPKYLQPLARTNDDDPRIVDQFQLVVGGWELGKGYSELVDPHEQAARFSEQSQAKDKGEGEVMEGDDEYITAMEHGMPPISGWGMGIDRIVAILSGSNNLRDVVLFPLLRPDNSDKK